MSEDQQQVPPTGKPETMFVIESIEHTTGDFVVFWKPHKMGYTVNLMEAGLYSEAEAKEIVAKANIEGENERMWRREDIFVGKVGKMETVVRVPYVKGHL